MAERFECDVVMAQSTPTASEPGKGDPDAESRRLLTRDEENVRQTPLTPPGTSTLDQERQPRAASPARTDVLTIPMDPSRDEQRLIAQRMVAEANAYLASPGCRDPPGSRGGCTGAAARNTQDTGGSVPPAG